jgi:hypothetical protein
MKGILIISLLFAFLIAHGQKRKIIDLIIDEKHTLQGGSQEKGRLIIPINNIPENTTELTYTIHAYKKVRQSQVRPGEASPLSFAIPLGALGQLPVSSSYGNTNIPKGKHLVDIFLLPGDNDAQLFLDKNDTSWKHYPDFDNETCMRNCKVFVPWPLTGCTHPVLGIRNPSSYNRIKIAVSVAAVITK